jgi:DNA-binding CsgD family transcriptional regulator
MTAFCKVRSHVTVGAIHMLGDNGFEILVAADGVADANASWASLTRTLAGIGLDQVNYAFLDFASHTRLEARGDPGFSTMRADWIEYYTERQYDMNDDLVGHVRAGNYKPKFYRLGRPEEFTSLEMVGEAHEAGLHAGLLVPLCGDYGSALPTAGIVMGSSLPEADIEKIVQDYAPMLVALAHVFHAGMIGELRRRRVGAKPLSERERDCLQYAARGLRTTAIADRLNLSEATVELYLRNARRKLDAKTLAEAVARAIQFQQISLA